MLDELRRERRGLAVALNGEVLPRREWEARELQPDDRVEVLDARAGG